MHARVRNLAHAAHQPALDRKNVGYPARIALYRLGWRPIPCRGTEGWTGQVGQAFADFGLIFARAHHRCQIAGFLAPSERAVGLEEGPLEMVLRAKPLTGLEPGRRDPLSLPFRPPIDSRGARQR